MLGNLAKKLRILGYDSKYFSSIEDDKIISIAKNEKRIILTKDEQLTKIAEKQNVSFVLIRGNDELEQIVHDVYTTVHSHLKMHSCHYVHAEWRKRSKDYLKAAQQMGFLR